VEKPELVNIVSLSIAGRDSENQDCVAFRDKGVVRLLVAADGMGGAKGGGVASQEVVSVVTEEFDRFSEPPNDKTFEEIKRRFEMQAANNPLLSKMATTLTACLISGDQCEYVHVGDSRIYHLRGGGLLSRTKDQTELQHLLDEKIISRAKAKRYPRKNVLLSVISLLNDYEVERGVFKLATGDRLLVITDGIYNVLAKKELVRLSVRSASMEELVQSIEHEIITRGPVDDFSVVGYEHR
jgi:serine/threonine protein phosphatase PrpC